MSCQKKFRVVGDLKRHMVINSENKLSPHLLNQRFFFHQKIHERTKTGSAKEKKKETVLSIIKKEPTVPEVKVRESVRLQSASFMGKIFI